MPSQHLQALLEAVDGERDQPARLHLHHSQLEFLHRLLAFLGPLDGLPFQLRQVLLSRVFFHCPLHLPLPLQTTPLAIVGMPGFISRWIGELFTVG